MSKHRDVLLERILAVPNLARVVPQLQPDVLYRVIERCGLEHCGQLVALATPGQLARVFDLDLWRPAAPGLDEQFDANRFGTWLEVIAETDPSSAAAIFGKLDVDLAATGLVQHVRVFDYSAVAPYVTLDGELSTGLAIDDRARCEVGGYVLSATRAEFWSAITTVLIALADEDAAHFHQLMAACRRLSNSRPEIDVHDLPDADEQAMFDLAVDRESRRETQGFVAPAQARAFLQASRRIDLRQGTPPPADPMTRAYFSSIDRVAPADEVTPEAVAAILDLLNEAGVMPQAPVGRIGPAPRKRLEGESSSSRLARIRTLLEFVHDRDPDAYAMRNAELAYLANVIAAGSTIQSRPVAEDEASSGAVSVCNLGLENWPARWRPGSELPDDFLVHHDLVSVFQVGWTVLYEDVCMYAAGELIVLLPTVQCMDRDVQEALERLRVRLTKYWRAGSPWDAREALDVIATLDAPAWAALASVIDQFPTMHAALGATVAGSARQIDAAAFEFISHNGQIHAVQEFLRRLPSLLRS